MSRQFAFFVAFLSFSVPRHDTLADAFLLLSGVRTLTPTSTRELRLRYPGTNIRIMTRGLGITEERNVTPSRMALGRRRRTCLHSQTTTTTTTTTPSVEPQTPQMPYFAKLSSPAITTSQTTTAAKTSTPIPKKFNAARFVTTEGPDRSTKPDYENIHGPLSKTLDNIFLYVFRSQLAHYVGVDSKLPKTDYNGLIELTAALNARYSDRAQIQDIAQQTLRSLFPSWLPGWFAILFARPFPEFSSRMNAWATYMAGQWLMGECEINDIEIDGELKEGQGLLVKRCRFLEESGCASVCVNSCKIPTQKFFIEDMGLPLTMTPDYDTHECQFSFGRMPTQQDDLDAMGTPCLSRCPTAGSMRKWHDGSGSRSKSTSSNIASEDLLSSLLESEELPQLGKKCSFMENPPTGESQQKLQP